jgi:hypothetical protein
VTHSAMDFDPKDIEAAVLTRLVSLREAGEEVQAQQIAKYIVDLLTHAAVKFTHEIVKSFIQCTVCGTKYDQDWEKFPGSKWEDQPCPTCSQKEATHD